MSIKSFLKSRFGTTSSRSGLRVYDGVVHTYGSGEGSYPCPPDLLERLLGFEPNAVGLQYELSFMAGTTGVQDKVAIQATCSDTQWRTLVERLHLWDVEAVRDDARWVTEFAWLMGQETGTHFTRQDCESFIHSNRQFFQDEPTSRSALLFTYDSDVNSWRVVWRTDDRVNILSFDEG